MKRLRARCILALAGLAVLVAGILVQAQTLSQSTQDHAAVGSRGMVATAHPLASLAGVEILQKGGNAVDAAVAAAFVVGVVEPDASGLGGGGGMLIYLAKEQQSTYINYYPRASARCMEIEYHNNTDAQTGKAILVPGTVAGLTLALERFGTLPLAVVLEPAIRYAEQGFPIDETLTKIILDNLLLVQKHPGTASLYLRDEFPLMQGDTLTQHELARTLRAVAAQGRAGFYEGPVAQTLVEGVTRAGGSLTRDDLRLFQAELVKPLYGTYRDVQVLTPPPPHSGAFVMEALNMLEYEDLKELGHYAISGESLHMFAEVLRRAYADRTAFLADPRFESVPVDGLITKEYARNRFDDINRNVAEPPEYRKTRAGHPVGATEPSPRVPGIAPPVEEPELKHDAVPAPMRQDTPPGMFREQDTFAEHEGGGHTTHLCVADSAGNVVSLTQTLGTFFGSGVTVAGVLMNNARSNFSSTASRNAIEPGKQPRSSIAPTILLKDGKPVMAVGSPGATRIIATVVQCIVNVVDYSMSAIEANRAPRFLCQKLDDYLHLESRIAPDVREDLKRRGHSLRVYGDFDLFFGGAQIIVVDPVARRYYGSADPRRGGVAIGF